MKEIRVKAQASEVDIVTEFLEEELEEMNCSVKKRIQICVAADEIFGNIAMYAYPEGDGDVKISTETDESRIRITFEDSGIPYNPLLAEDPDITLPDDERMPGGLGILIVRQTMDEVLYEYKDGRNILTVVKNLAEEA